MTVFFVVLFHSPVHSPCRRAHKLGENRLEMYEYTPGCRYVRKARALLDFPHVSGPNGSNSENTKSFQGFCDTQTQVFTVLQPLLSQ